MSVEFSCKVDGRDVTELCKEAIRKRKVKALVNCTTEPITARLRVKAKRDGFRRQTWTGRWKVNPSEQTICQAKGNG